MDTRALKELMEELLNENIAVPINDKYKISIRTKFSASHSGNVSQHGTSIKIVTRGCTYQIEIPTKSYLNLSRSDKALQSMKDFKKIKNIKQSIIDFIESFIYVNQAVILAYWYGPNDDKFEDAIEKYINQQDIDYFNISASPKTDAELESDKRVITEFVHKELNDQTIELDFGK